MKQATTLILALVTVLVLAQFAVSYQGAPAAQPNIFDGLRVGQDVGLVPVGSNYSVVVDPQRGRVDVYTVLDVQRYFITVQDRSRNSELRIPVSAIRDISISRTGVRS